MAIKIPEYRIHTENHVGEDMQTNGGTPVAMFSAEHACQ